MTTQSEPFGFLAVNKPRGLTSHDVVAKVRRGTGIRRVGHAGTLDPLATGMLIVCVGAATRLSEYVMHTDKLYHATLRLGVETDTYDAEGRVVAERDASHISETMLDATCAQFRGEIAQIPPMYSAIKQGGKPLYKLARAGQEVERQPRPVIIYALHLYEYAPPEAKIVVWCTSGTYIRSLAHDIGEALGVGAHLTALDRRVSGAFNSMVEWEALLHAFEAGTWRDLLLTERLGMPHIPPLPLTDEETDAILHGRTIPREGEIGKVALRRAYAPDDRFIAILEAHQGQWRPIKVFQHERTPEGQQEEDSAQDDS
jgi:tRNA pseudouridine55 synthase